MVDQLQGQLLSAVDDEYHISGFPLGKNHGDQRHHLTWKPTWTSSNIMLQGSYCSYWLLDHHPRPVQSRQMHLDLSTRPNLSIDWRKGHCYRKPQISGFPRHCPFKQLSKSEFWQYLRSTYPHKNRYSKSKTFLQGQEPDPSPFQYSYGSKWATRVFTAPLMTGDPRFHQQNEKNGHLGLAKNIAVLQCSSMLPKRLTNDITMLPYLPYVSCFQ